MTTRIARVTLTIKLTAGKDDDIMDWLASLRKGERQASAKRMLREAVQALPDDEKQTAQIRANTTWLKATLFFMLTKPSPWMRKLHAQVSFPPKAEHGRRHEVVQPHR